MSRRGICHIFFRGRHTLVPSVFVPFDQVVLGYTGVYKCIHGYIVVYKSIQGYTWIYKGLHGYIRLTWVFIVHH